MHLGLCVRAFTCVFGKRALNVQVCTETGLQIKTCRFLKVLVVCRDVSLKELSDMTDGFSGADIHSLCRDWAMEGVRRLIAGKSPQEILALDNSPQLRYPLSMDQFLCSRKKASPSVAAAEIKQYQEWQALYGST
mmetsp:Transcript_51053/g.100074  ORF Transcript_51053/g.100074 Transcript_51053/m.100074 type:complete len:135 (-) Transcript_51053:171-575(-)